MGLGLGLGLGVPLVTGTAIGTFFGITSYNSNKYKQQGSEKFTSWTTSDGKGILDWAKSAHFPANLPDKKIVDGGQVNQVKNFITEYLNPGVLADGLIQTKVNDGLLTDATAEENDLLEGSIDWDGSGDKTTVNFNLKLQPKDDSNSEPIQDSVTYTFEEKDGNKYGKVTVETKSTITTQENKVSCENIDYMINIDSTEPSRFAIKANKKKGWEILYQPGQDGQNASVVIPYEDFGDNLEVIDGAASDLVLSIDTPEWIDDDEPGEYPLTATYSGASLDINMCDVYLNKQGIAGSYFEDGKIKINPIKAGDIELTIRAVSGKHVGVIHKAMTICKVYNKFVLVDGTKIKMKDELDVSELCSNSYTINVTSNHGTDKQSVNVGEIREVVINKIADGVTTIPNDFLRGCGSGGNPVKEINFNAFKSITSIGDNFLNEAKCDVVDMSALTNLNSISYMFHYCQINKIIFPIESNISDIIDRAFMYFSVKEIVNMGLFFQNVVTIGADFISFSYGYANFLDLSQMNKVETIGDGFLDDNSTYNVDLSGMTSLKNIGANFMNNTKYLLSVKLPRINPSSITSFSGWGVDIGKKNGWRGWEEPEVDPVPVNIDCGTAELKAAYSSDQKWGNTSGFTWGAVWKP